MKAVYKHYGNVYAGFLQKHYHNLYLEGIWLNGGDWDAALCVLGFTPERMRQGTYLEVERVVAKIRSYGKKAYLFIRNTSSNTTLHCSRQLYAYLGLGQTHYLPTVSKFLTTRIMRVAEFHGLCVMLWSSIRRMIFQRTELHAAYYFGSLGKAKAALKTDRRFGAGWSTTKIIAGIRQRRRLGKPLGYPAARRDNPALVSVAEAYFGSWGNALYATGIDPNLYLHRKWRRRRMPAKRDGLSYGKVFNPSVPAL